MPYLQRASSRRVSSPRCHRPAGVAAAAPHGAIAGRCPQSSGGRQNPAVPTRPHSHSPSPKAKTVSSAARRLNRRYWTRRASRSRASLNTIRLQLRRKLDEALAPPLMTNMPSPTSEWGQNPATTPHCRTFQRHQTPQSSLRQHSSSGASQSPAGVRSGKRLSLRVSATFSGKLFGG